MLNFKFVLVVFIALTIVGTIDGFISSSIKNPNVKSLKMNFADDIATVFSQSNTNILGEITSAFSQPNYSLLVDSNYNLAAGCAVIGTMFGILENFKGPAGKIFGAGSIAFIIFAAFITFQTTTLRFQFDSSSFSLVKADGSSNGKNIVVGGENSWKYSSFQNYAFLPNEEFPILVYFRETQTPEKDWAEVPITVDKAKGQVHFFPAIANTQQLKTAFTLNKCKKL